MKKEEEIAKIKEDVEACRECGLWKTRNKPVPGEGSLEPKVMFVGEAPGGEEDKNGLPFVGRAGKLLDELLGIAGIQRSEVFIGNVIKCRPPGNRDPQPEEIRACTPFLDRQLDVMRPGVIAPLGNFATSYIMEKYGLRPERVGKVHGEVFPVSNLMIKTKIVPLYHPAAALRNPNLKAIMIEDFRTLSKIVNENKNQES